MASKGLCLKFFKRKDNEVEDLKAEVKRLRGACAKMNEEVCQTLGAVLGYPRYSDDQKNFPGSTPDDGVCVGDHVAESIAAEAANRINNLTEAINEIVREAR